MYRQTAHKGTCIYVTVYESYYMNESVLLLVFLNLATYIFLSIDA